MLIGSGRVSTEGQPAVKQGLRQELRRMWQQAIDDKRPGVPENEVFDRLGNR